MNYGDSISVCDDIPAERKQGWIKSGYVKLGESTTTTLDDAFEQGVFPRKVDVMKMDVEGYEPRVLEGGRKFLSSKKAPDKIIMESMPIILQAAMGGDGNAHMKKEFTTLLGLGYVAGGMDSEDKIAKGVEQYIGDPEFLHVGAAAMGVGGQVFLEEPGEGEVRENEKTVRTTAFLEEGQTLSASEIGGEGGASTLMRRALLVDEQRERLRRKRTIVFERRGGRGGAGSTDPVVSGEEQVWGQDLSAIELGDADNMSGNSSPDHTGRIILSADEDKRPYHLRVRDALKFSFDQYQKHAWGRDAIDSKTGEGHDWIGLGVSLLDMLDTLHITGLHDEFARGVEWVKSDFLQQPSGLAASFFEVSIRGLGGLLGAYSLSGDEVLLKKAKQLGEMLSDGAFHARKGQLLPIRSPRMTEQRHRDPRPSSAIETTIAEAASEQLEFRFLAREANRKDLAVYPDRAFQAIVDESRKRHQAVIEPCVTQRPGETVGRNSSREEKLFCKFFWKIGARWILRGFFI